MLKNYAYLPGLEEIKQGQIRDKIVRFRFSYSITLICSILAALMAYASYWQYTRYISKLSYIEELDNRLKLNIEPLSKLLQNDPDPSNLLHRRVSLKGIWDYKNEIIIRNRKLDDIAGVHVVTPLLIDGLEDKRILVSRGFLPLSSSDKESRIKYQNGPIENFTALIQETNNPKLFAPQDPKAGLDLPWVDAWLRVDIKAIANQLSYQILPFYLEMISRDTTTLDSNKFLEQKSERDKILFLPGAGAKLNSVKEDKRNIDYPVPVFDPIVPAGRHYSYIFEWAIMSLMVIIAALILQLRRN